jgi:hypothetical protein
VSAAFVTHLDKMPLPCGFYVVCTLPKIILFKGVLTD